MGGRWWQTVELGLPSAWTKPAHGSHIHIYFYSVHSLYTIDPKLINKITKFILTPQTWPTPSVSPLDLHIKEEKECESKCLQPRIKYTNNKGNRKKEKNLGTVISTRPTFLRWLVSRFFHFKENTSSKECIIVHCFHALSVGNEAFSHSHHQLCPRKPSILSKLVFVSLNQSALGA